MKPPPRKKEELTKSNVDSSTHSHTPQSPQIPLSTQCRPPMSPTKKFDADSDDDDATVAAIADAAEWGADDNTIAAVAVSPMLPSRLRSGMPTSRTEPLVSITLYRLLRGL